MPYSHLAPRSPHAGKRHSFLLGLGQMVLVSINWKCVANGNVVFSVIFTIVNTLYLQMMTRTYIHSTGWERIANALGAAFGVVAGIVIHYYILKPLAFTQLATLHLR